MAARCAHIACSDHSDFSTHEETPFKKPYVFPKLVRAVLTFPSNLRFAGSTGAVELLEYCEQRRLGPYHYSNTPILQSLITPLLRVWLFFFCRFGGSPIFSGDTKLAFRNSRLNRAMLEMEISLGQTGLGIPCGWCNFRNPAHPFF